jgi:hypothetical protein
MCAPDFTQWFENSIKAAGIEDFRYHDLRHTFASRLAMNGVPLAAVMECLGHTSLNMVLRTLAWRQGTKGEHRDAGEDVSGSRAGNAHQGSGKEDPKAAGTGGPGATEKSKSL